MLWLVFSIIVALLLQQFIMLTRFPKSHPDRARYVTTIIALLVVCSLVGYVFGLEKKSWNELSRHIVPYPNATFAGWVPPVSNEEHIWRLKTSDDIRTVEQFYRDVALAKDWEYTSGEEENKIVIVIGKSDDEIFIVVVGGPEGGAKIYYTPSGELKLGV